MAYEEAVKTHIQIVWAFVRVLLLKQVLHDLVPDTKIDLWRVMMSGAMDLAVIDWCKVLGSRNDDTHWTKLVPESDHAAFREGLFQAVHMSEQQWTEYHEHMKGYRDEHAGHRDLDPTVNMYPELDAALQAAYYYYERYLYPEWKKVGGADYPDDLSAYADRYQAELKEAAFLATQATKPLDPKIER
ncbi:hypothetical protein [Pararobbsia silviterrae]|uniref:Uncharacterized protein n=1 Tax=Pararobbsia silviterrae TaxID=1792498 RepID=A0A494Y7P3_9BURK|nr:hypothetical protein [Pararobbsia silviterrae]RKP56346.1 hypothetical protein D7S86_08075 [Pararobbsia silviterrae]